MRICFYSPYMPESTGGGEKHLIDIALVMAKSNEVTIALRDLPAHTDKEFLKSVKTQYQQFLNNSLENITFIVSPLGGNQNALQKLLWTRQFDYIFYTTDGSFFLP